jgi:hypothetical protein
MLARLDEVFDTVLYRPAIVRAFRWFPRWWMCDLARASMWLDNRWETHWWRSAIVPERACAACGRRASIAVIDGVDGSEIGLCGWCVIEGPVFTQADMDRELAAARARSVASRWRRCAS